jgi:hypothetical protein
LVYTYIHIQWISTSAAQDSKNSNYLAKVKLALSFSRNANRQEGREEPVLLNIKQMFFSCIHQKMNPKRKKQEATGNDAHQNALAT